MERYFIGYAQPKSCCEIPSSWNRVYYVVKEGEDPEEIRKENTRYCEDWDISEVSKDEYAKFMNQ